MNIYIYIYILEIKDRTLLKFNPKQGERVERLPYINKQ